MRLESDPECAPLGAIFGAVAIVALLGAAAWIEFGLPQPGCPLRALTGLPCPTCGSTRLVEALVAGDALGALRWNPLLFCAGALVALWALVSAGSRLLGLPGRRIVLERREGRWLRGLAAAAIALDWAYLAWRGI